MLSVIMPERDSQKVHILYFVTSDDEGWSFLCFICLNITEKNAKEFLIFLEVDKHG